MPPFGGFVVTYNWELTLQSAQNFLIYPIWESPGRSWKLLTRRRISGILEFQTSGAEIQWMDSWMEPWRSECVMVLVSLVFFCVSVLNFYFFPVYVPYFPGFLSLVWLPLVFWICLCSFGCVCLVFGLIYLILTLAYLWLWVCFCTIKKNKLDWSKTACCVCKLGPSLFPSVPGTHVKHCTLSENGPWRRRHFFVFSRSTCEMKIITCSYILKFLIKERE